VVAVPGSATEALADAAADAAMVQRLLVDRPQQQELPGEAPNDGDEQHGFALPASPPLESRSVDTDGSVTAEIDDESAVRPVADNRPFPAAPPSCEATVSSHTDRHCIVSAAAGMAEVLRAAGIANDIPKCFEALQLLAERLRASQGPSFAPMGEEPRRATAGVAPVDVPGVPSSTRHRGDGDAERALWPYEDLELEPIEWGE